MTSILSFLMAIVNWFPHEVYVALIGLVGAGAVDAALTIILAIQGRLEKPFDWRRVPQFLYVNVLGPALGFLVAGAVVKFHPEVSGEYLAAVALVGAWLNKDWKRKFTVIIGVKLPETLTKQA